MSKTRKNLQQRVEHIRVQRDADQGQATAEYHERCRGFGSTFAATNQWSGEGQIRLSKRNQKNGSHKNIKQLLSPEDSKEPRLGKDPSLALFDLHKNSVDRPGSPYKRTGNDWSVHELDSLGRRGSAKAAALYGRSANSSTQQMYQQTPGPLPVDSGSSVSFKKRGLEKRLTKPLR